jgi:molecular chaperone GrpE (heat shock protein)
MSRPTRKHTHVDPEVEDLERRHQALGGVKGLAPLTITMDDIDDSLKAKGHDLEPWKKLKAREKRALWLLWNLKQKGKDTKTYEFSGEEALNEWQRVKRVRDLHPPEERGTRYSLSVLRNVADKVKTFFDSEARGRNFKTSKLMGDEDEDEEEEEHDPFKYGDEEHDEDFPERHVPLPAGVQDSPPPVLRPTVAAGTRRTAVQILTPSKQRLQQAEREVYELQEQIRQRSEERRETEEVTIEEMTRVNALKDQLQKTQEQLQRINAEYSKLESEHKGSQTLSKKNITTLTTQTQDLERQIDELNRQKKIMGDKILELKESVKESVTCVANSLSGFLSFMC